MGMGRGQEWAQDGHGEMRWGQDGGGHKELRTEWAQMGTNGCSGMGWAESDGDRNGYKMMEIKLALGWAHGDGHRVKGEGTEVGTG